MGRSEVRRLAATAAALRYYSSSSSLLMPHSAAPAYQAAPSNTKVGLTSPCPDVTLPQRRCAPPHPPAAAPPRTATWRRAATSLASARSAPAASLATPPPAPASRYVQRGGAGSSAGGRVAAKPQQAPRAALLLNNCAGWSSHPWQQYTHHHTLPLTARAPCHPATSAAACAAGRLRQGGLPQCRPLRALHPGLEPEPLHRRVRGVHR